MIIQTTTIQSSLTAHHALKTVLAFSMAAALKTIVASVTTMHRTTTQSCPTGQRVCRTVTTCGAELPNKTPVVCVIAIRPTTTRRFPTAEPARWTASASGLAQRSLMPAGCATAITVRVQTVMENQTAAHLSTIVASVSAVRRAKSQAATTAVTDQIHSLMTAETVLAVRRA